MQAFKVWLENELNDIEDQLASVPTNKRKGLATYTLRMRTSDIEAALLLVQQFEGEMAARCVPATSSS